MGFGGSGGFQFNYRKLLGSNNIWTGTNIFSGSIITAGTFDITGSLGVSGSLTVGGNVTVSGSVYGANGNAFMLSYFTGTWNDHDDWQSNGAYYIMSLTHSIGTKAIMVQTWQVNGSGFERVFPDRIKCYDKDTVEIRVISGSTYEGYAIVNGYK